MTSRNPEIPRSPHARRARWPLGRVWAIALVTFRQAVRMRLWILAPVALLILILADLSSERFDPVFEAIPAAISTSIFVMAVLAVVLAVFFSTYSIPAEMESKVATSVITKPVSRGEFVAGKTLGMSILVLAMLGLMAVGLYAYVVIRARGIQSLAARRLEEARPRAVHPADLNALDAVARHGPLLTYRYQTVTLGPDVRIHFPPDMPPQPDTQWILGETGMRMIWNLTDTPLREWVAAGPTRLRVALAIRRPPDAPPASSTPVTVALAAPQDRALRQLSAASEKPLPVLQVAAGVPASGELDLTLVDFSTRPMKGVLNVPREGPLFLEMAASAAGDLVGATAGAILIEGPAGRTFAVREAPRVVAANEPGKEPRKLLLVGRSPLPRQVAIFRFDEVPPGVMNPGDACFEIGFSLDAWGPAMVQPTVEATFIKPETGAQRILQFTPESHHSSLVYLDRAFWHGGPLEVRLECLTTDDYLGLAPESVRWRLDGGPFALHLAKAVLCVWFFGTVLATAGVLFSTRFTWYTSILCTVAFLILSVMHDFLLQGTVLGHYAFRLARWADAHVSWHGWYPLAQRLVVPVPDVRALLPDESVNMGQVMPLGDLGVLCGGAVLGVVVLAFLGMLLLRNREVAA